MLVLLAGIFVIHIATVIMLFVSTISNVWLASSLMNQNGTVGLWLQCIAGHCKQAEIHTEESMKAVQAFMILAIIFSFVSLVMFVVQLFTLEKGKRFYIAGTIMLVCWLCILIAASIFTARYSDYFMSSHHGYCFILAWICFCFSFIIGILYLVLRKK
ncbi:PREDICTED: epithelial membrane protein 1 [Gavialis gangeticus]|uniref:epithelial membrane protein 1 n=1 Tax=Gavialis gangeticus TaxID=94835 RepID=UPI00092F6C19|nr:PREDICTED: epithelial membrane protein 1 [Gavialis gangeticus]